MALLLYGLLAVLMTWPLAAQAGASLLGTDTNALNDSYFSVWIFGWQAHQLILDPLNLYQGNIFYPFANTLAFSEIILPGALLYLPLEYATANPILAYNLVVIISFVLNAYAMFVFALDVLTATPLAAEGKNERVSLDTPRYAAAFLAGITFAFNTYKLGEIRHVQLLLALFMPLTLLYLARGLRRPNARNALLTGLFFALNALASLYYAVFLALAMVVYVVADWIIRRYRITRAHLTYAVLAGAIALLLFAPFALPFLQLEGQYNFSGTRDPRLFAARPASYVASLPTHWLYGTLTSGAYVASKGQPLFPGVSVLALALGGLGFMVWRRRWSWLIWLGIGMLGLVLSFGPELILGREIRAAIPHHLPYHYLAQVLTPLKSLNAPARFAVLVMLALAVLAAYGAWWLMQRRPRWAGGIAAALSLLIVAEYIPAPLRLVPVDAGAAVSPVYRFLAQQPRGEPVIEMPMGGPTFAEQDRYVVYTYSSIYHWQPLVNGYSTFIPPEYYELARDMQKFPTRGTIKRLHDWGVKWVVFHPDRYPNSAALRAKLDSLDTIVHVQDYDDAWLYRIP